jgi:type II secretory pathway component PulF
MSRLTWSLAMATDSDLPPDKAIEQADRSTQNGYYTDQIEQMKLTIRRGGEMHDAFRATKAYPDDFLDALQTGEVAGRITETMTVVAKDSDERAKMWYRGLAVACGAAVFLTVIALMVFMIFNLFFNLYMKPINDTLDSL